MERGIFYALLKAHFQDWQPNPFSCRIALGAIFTFSNLPNNSFTSIKGSPPIASVISFFRCKGAYEVFTDVQGRALRFGKKSSLRPLVARYFMPKPCTS